MVTNLSFRWEGMLLWSKETSQWKGHHLVLRKWAGLELEPSLKVMMMWSKKRVLLVDKQHSFRIHHLQVEDRTRKYQMWTWCHCFKRNRICRTSTLKYVHPISPMPSSKVLDQLSQWKKEVSTCLPLWDHSHSKNHPLPLPRRREI